MMNQIPVLVKVRHDLFVVGSFKISKLLQWYADELQWSSFTGKIFALLLSSCTQNLNTSRVHVYTVFLFFPRK